MWKAVAALAVLFVLNLVIQSLTQRWILRRKYRDIRRRMGYLVLALALSLVAIPCQAQPSSKLKKVLTVVEHLALGAGTQLAVSYAAGGPNKWPAGLVAAGIVAGFKEGADAVAKRDTPKQAAIHALTILAGAGVTAAVEAKH